MVIVFNWLNLSLPIQLPINIKCFIQISKLLVIFTNKSNIDASNFMLVLSFILLMQISLPKQFINQWNIQIKQYIEQLRRNCFIKVKEDLEKFDISEINIWSYFSFFSFSFWYISEPYSHIIGYKQIAKYTYYHKR